MWKTEIKINNFEGGVSTIQSWSMSDNQLLVAKNMYYNKDRQLITRMGYKEYLPKISTNPITSYFFHQRDDWQGKFVLAVCGDVMYSYNEGLNARTSIKTWIAEFETNPLFNWARTRRDFAVYNNIVYMCNGVDNYASRNGTTYTEYSGQPKCRYIQYLWDRIYWAWEDANPITLYYTWAVPTNANTLNANFVKVGGDETWAINWLSEIWNLIIATKDAKIYVVNPVSWTATPIDAQGGWFCNRSLKNVWNALVFFNEKGIDTLKQRQGVTWSTWLETSSISEDVITIFNKVQRKNYNFQCSMYNRIDWKYYVCIDSNNDTVPDTMLVFSSVTWSWTSYDMPSMFDMWIYIDNNQNTHYLFAWTDWQMYEFEAWGVDYWNSISYEAQTKKRDAGEPWRLKTYSYIDIIWYKSAWTAIDVWVYSEDIFQTWGSITDANIDYSVSYKTIWSASVWSLPLWWEQQGDETKIYLYSVRIACYITWQNISLKLSSEWWTRTIDRVRIGIEWQPIDVFYTNQYL
jgi:hypothetical protein